jgi:3',5'-cyclic-AMP phosphodiesterase
MMRDEIVYFVHISDTHLGPDPDFELYGRKPHPYAGQLVEIINNLPTRPDFVMHTGDVVADPDPDSYMLAAETLAQLNVPIYYANGNHDSASDIHQYLAMGPKEALSEDQDVLFYAFEMKGYRFLVLDGRGPDAIDPKGLISEAQLEVVRREATPEGPPLVIFIHFPVLPMNSPWMDENMLLMNGPALHQALLPARNRIRGIFHGHVHQAVQTSQDTLVYTAVASTFFQFSAWPTDQDIGYAPGQPAGYNFVHLTPERTIVHQHTITVKQ